MSDTYTVEETTTVETTGGIVTVSTGTRLRRLDNPRFVEIVNEETESKETESETESKETNQPVIRRATSKR